MQLKRKRSDSEISTNSSLLSSPPSAHIMPMSIGSMDAQISNPSLFSSRTRKRHRDNRPDEDTIHQNTLSLLFSAQQPSHTQAQPHPRSLNVPPPAFQNLANIPLAPSPHQSSLHSFWALPKQRSSSSSTNSSNASTPNTTPYHATCFQATNCEDCDASLNGSGGDGMDVDMMDVDMVIGGEDYGCSICGKQVCRQCAISNLGMERKCLSCAGQRGKRWEGGIGWVDAS